jgi:hypothetical protein
VPDTDTTLLRRLTGGDAAAATQVAERARDSGSPSILVAAALLTGQPDLLVRAARHATTTRERQLVALADTHLRGDTDRLDVLLREHLAEHPDNSLAAWIGQRTARP